MPRVSIIVPCYNEQTTIRLLLEALRQQTFPRAEMEVVIADGMSSDGTRAEIAAFQKDFPNLDVRVVDNPLRSIPSGVNRAIEVSRGGIIVRLDAHSKPYPDYVANCVSAIESGRGDNIGGVWEIRPGADTWIAKSIAVAAAHPLGVGDALYRHARHAAEVDTVPFGSFKRGLIDRVGYFDESLLTNEDYEFNARIRKAGGRIWLDPSIRSIYFARPTLLELARQYWRYGFWKWRMLRRYPDTLRWRQALPPLFVLSLIGLAFLSLFFPLAGFALIGELALYFSVMILAGLSATLSRRKPYLVFGLPLAIPVMHLTWGSGFLWSILKSSPKKNG
ncbi:MAG: glycosyltransferase family 2 protein [Anaerolineales bacterium]|nr:glycosyltransferase family 2 protein [Anaerolineae bacterium]PWB72407.1 MAG: glycosyltransferase family 2 protein [Anaerolineales bacterium]